MIQNLKQENDIFNNVTFRYKTPDGVAYIQIVESRPGQVEKIIISLGKAGNSANAWAYALAEMTTDLLKSGDNLNAVINTLSNISTDKVERNPNGIVCRSGPEALFLALLDYRRSLPKELDESEYKPARIRMRIR